MEIWKDMPGIDGYKVSNMGNIIGRNGKIMKLQPNHKGYPMVRTWNPKKSFLVHRLVAKLFIPNPKGLPQVDHLNGIKTDNRVENLEWVTQSENARRSFVLGLQNNKGSKHPRARLTEADVEEIRNAIIGPFTMSRKDIAAKFGITEGHVKDIRDRRAWTHI